MIFEITQLNNKRGSLTDEEYRTVKSSVLHT